MRASSEETILRATKALARFDKAVKKSFLLASKRNGWLYGSIH